VIVPTYERHEHLGELMASLAMQRFTDFEVIVVDQSAAEWSGREGYSELDLAYLHPPTPGAVLARNMGASCARGEILAFIDDDCLAFPDWLAGAAPYFEDPGVVGVEGLILSARRDDSRYRAVTNQGFEGLGFMTANLFLRRETFATVNGFDPAFEHPHFREDTDLAWRALKLGRIPFARDVRVYHPPHPRELDRESGETRAQFFEKDALLLQKHPDRFRELFMNEAHYLRTEGFAENFLRGAQKYGVLVDPFYLDLLAAARGGKELGGGFGA
jgi:glycosyltransferase involved in cell wall biosynthesis